MLKGEYLFGTDDIQKCFTIRDKVFRQELNINHKDLFDPIDKESIHVLITFQNKPVATGRLFYNGTFYKMGRIAVLKEYRKNKIGEFLVTMMLDKAFSMGAKFVVVNAQESAIGFYKKLGFVINKENPVFELGLLHYEMMLEARESKCKQ
ncbi:putative GNAT family N-acyltransferase [Natranaerovirga hydrolytica]|uniref:Putative GNAT family N-acyltransferase n=1 Tax=Natranaerovirga hydrolytica TaxID=680378 RepID=A0A4R1MAJ5_9FIRM|nr:GNAT family N-acetyltransferase [Natranaerovirga hydrolytica]TCK86783.1 putative GNAT family N-acyltransferase [Natranaerovirga hydrolytica]